jgi:hypothetical protein
MHFRLLGNPPRFSVNVVGGLQPLFRLMSFVATDHVNVPPTSLNLLRPLGPFEILTVRKLDLLSGPLGRIQVEVQNFNLILLLFFRLGTNENSLPHISKFE